jgi:Fic family protein
MMMDLYDDFTQTISHETLFRWHNMLTKGRRDLQIVGAYRTHPDPMQVVFGPIHTPKIHFEAPPSAQVFAEMENYVRWYDRSIPGKPEKLTTLTQAGIAHWYFVIIHPFEDGNGRIARALAAKVLAQCLGQPVVLSLARTIQKNKKAYYQILEDSNKSNEITAYLNYFSKTVLEAQAYTQKMIDFLISKTQLYDRVKTALNTRQEKVLARMFREGLEGFKGGLSASNYISMTESSRATATRDLQDLVEKKVLYKTGELKGSRYYLNI